ncbi:unnamed protein product [Mesocestoides corti]|uniref:C2H2-type domain-containing protein n=1 Tax=Mesocestoides corti TaxID=53468 RepID=A0A0R3UKI5_MESCO|nr:unnamed protein product [Mesocestoides corti]
MLQSNASGTTTKLTTFLNYSRYPPCLWTDLSEAVRGIISTRVLQAPLPLYVLLTSGDERPWKRLQLSHSDLVNKSENSSMELIAAHLRLHTELRCCEKCATVLPNSALAVDAPDAQQHRCSNLVTARHADVAVECMCLYLLQIDFYHRSAGLNLVVNSMFAPFQPCDTEFNSVIQYQQHLKNVHNKNRFVCPECSESYVVKPRLNSLEFPNTTFSTKGNMTTHFQRVHNQSDSVVCPVCSKRMSSQ